AREVKLDPKSGLAQILVAAQDVANNALIYSNWSALARSPDVLTWRAEEIDLLAFLLFASPQKDESLALLRSAVSQRPGDFALNFSLGWYLEEATPHPNDAGDAVRYLTAAAALRPDSAQAAFQLGIALSRRGDYEQA